MLPAEHPRFTPVLERCSRATKVQGNMTMFYGKRAKLFLHWALPLLHRRWMAAEVPGYIIKRRDRAKSAVVPRLPSQLAFHQVIGGPNSCTKNAIRISAVTILKASFDARLGNAAVAAACMATLYPAISRGTPPPFRIPTTPHRLIFLVNNGAISFQLYDTGALAGKITSITYNGQQMIGSKDIYYDIQGSPNIYLGSGESYTYRTGSNFVDITAEHPATATKPLDVTWHWILEDGQPGFSTYLTYHHTTAMADYLAAENRLGAEFFNGNLFHYSSIADNFWGYQSAGDADRGQGRFITAETSDMRGIPSEYIKNYETKYDWRTTQQGDNGVTGIVTAANTTNSTRPLIATDYGAWNISDYRSDESLNAGPTHPQSPVADRAINYPQPGGIALRRASAHVHRQHGQSFRAIPDLFQ